MIAWASDPVELFFLQIQGSGQIRLESGERIRIGFADQNGHPYSSLGRYLVDRGELPLDQTSMQGIKAWAAANPAKLQEALNSNPSYVFFRELPPAADGPPGALGVPLTAEYSLAVDRRFVPLGAPVYLATMHPIIGPEARAHDGGAGHRRGDPRRGARGFLLGHRRRRGRRCGPHAPAGKDVAACGRAASRRPARTSGAGRAGP